MLQNWLKPVDSSLLENNSSSNVLLDSIQIHTQKIPALKDVKIALIGIDSDSSNAIRKELYILSNSFNNLKIADLGDVRKTTPSFIIPVIKELLDSKIFPIILSKNEELFQVQFQAHHNTNTSTNLITIDERIRCELNSKKKENYLNKIIKSRKLFNLGVIGYQSHYADREVLKHFEKRYFDHLRLGHVRANMELSEPIIRNADIAGFNIASIRQSDAPAYHNPSPNGFFGEEACQLSRYIGMSDKINSFGIYGFDNSLDQNKQTAQLVAQMIWYFLDGYSNRKKDYPASTDGLLEYIVAFKKNDFQVTFWKSKKSGRWWVQVPVKTKKKHQRHRLIPCTYQDYQMACSDELPDRLWIAFDRFS